MDTPTTTSTTSTATLRNPSDRPVLLALADDRTWPKAIELAAASDAEVILYDRSRRPVGPSPQGRRWAAQLDPITFDRLAEAFVEAAVADVDCSVWLASDPTPGGLADCLARLRVDALVLPDDPSSWLGCEDVLGVTGRLPVLFIEPDGHLHARRAGRVAA